MKVQRLKRNLAKIICEKSVECTKKFVGNSFPATFYEIPIPEELQQKDNEKVRTN